MRNAQQWLLAILFIVLGGMLFGVAGLALAGIITGWFSNSRKRGFSMAGLVAAVFWGVVGVAKVLSGQSQPLLSLTASLLKFTGLQAWLLILGSALLAFLAGGLGGWLGGSLRQVKN